MNTDHIILSIGVALIVAGISVVFFLLSQDSTSPESEEDILKMAPTDSPAAVASPDTEDSMATLDKLMERQDKDITAVMGHTDLYHWTQSPTEVEVYVKVDADVPTKGIEIDTTATTCRISFNGVVVKEGLLCEEVVPDECNWQIDGAGEDRRVWMTLVKKTATKGNQHWKHVFRGDPEVDLSSFGPPVHAFDSNNIDKEALRRQVAQLRGKK